MMFDRWLFYLLFVLQTFIQVIILQILLSRKFCFAKFRAFMIYIQVFFLELLFYNNSNFSQGADVTSASP